MFWENSQDMVLTDEMCVKSTCMYVCTCVCVEMKNKQVNKFQRKNNVEN